MTERCSQCGREGLRGFKVIPPVLVDWLQPKIPAFWTTPITVCAAEKACRRRWPKRGDRDE